MERRTSAATSAEEVRELALAVFREEFQSAHAAAKAHLSGSTAVESDGSSSSKATKVDAIEIEKVRNRIEYAVKKMKKAQDNGENIDTVDNTGIDAIPRSVVFELSNELNNKRYKSARAASIAYLENLAKINNTEVDQSVAEKLCSRIQFHRKKMRKKQAEAAAAHGALAAAATASDSDSPAKQSKKRSFSKAEVADDDNDDDGGYEEGAVGGGDEEEVEVLAAGPNTKPCGKTFRVTLSSVEDAKLRIAAAGLSSAALADLHRQVGSPAPINAVFIDKRRRVRSVLRHIEGTLYDYEVRSVLCVQNVLAGSGSTLCTRCSNVRTALRKSLAKYKSDHVDIPDIGAQQSGSDESLVPSDDDDDDSSSSDASVTAAAAAGFGKTNGVKGASIVELTQRVALLEKTVSELAKGSAISETAGVSAAETAGFGAEEATLGASAGQSSALAAAALAGYGGSTSPLVSSAMTNAVASGSSSSDSSVVGGPPSVGKVIKVQLKPSSAGSKVSKKKTK